MQFHIRGEEMAQSEDTVTLITLDRTKATAAIPGSIGDVLAGDVPKKVEIAADEVRDNIGQCLAQMQKVFANLEQPLVEGWQMQSISLGLIITAEGSVGIATAGVEATIQISFSPTP